MSVLKNNRKESRFEVYHKIFKVRREITDLLLRDFGVTEDKLNKKIERKFGGTPYEELGEKEKGIYDKIKKRNESFEEWFIVDQRKIIIDCLRDIVKYIYIANNIFPTCIEEANERRVYQDKAIGCCYVLLQELHYSIENLPTSLVIYTKFASDIQEEINLIKAWRKSDNKIKRAFSTPSTNFANVNNNGNANNNGATYAYGVRPAFGDVI